MLLTLTLAGMLLAQVQYPDSWNVGRRAAVDSIGRAHEIPVFIWVGGESPAVGGRYAVRPEIAVVVKLDDEFRRARNISLELLNARMDGTAVVLTGVERTMTGANAERTQVTRIYSRDAQGEWRLISSTMRPMSAAQREGGAPAAGEQFAGVWSGTWDGAGSGGGFELVIERDKEKKLTATVSVTGEPTYKATLASIAFDGAKMTGKYDFPEDNAAEVVLNATFEEKAANGTWSLREKASGNEVASGNWKVTRKPPAP